jgi:predicted RNase H-like HicB family nuclease
MNFTALVHNDEDGGFWAEVEELPGCITQGDTELELEANLKEVIELFLDGLIQDYVESLAQKDDHAGETADAKWPIALNLKRAKATTKA